MSTLLTALPGVALRTMLCSNCARHPDIRSYNKDDVRSFMEKKKQAEKARRESAARERDSWERLREANLQQLEEERRQQRTAVIRSSPSRRGGQRRQRHDDGEAVAAETPVGSSAKAQSYAAQSRIPNTGGVQQNSEPSETRAASAGSEAAEDALGARPTVAVCSDPSPSPLQLAHSLGPPFSDPFVTASAFLQGISQLAGSLAWRMQQLGPQIPADMLSQLQRRATDALGPLLHSGMADPVADAMVGLDLATASHLGLGDESQVAESDEMPGVALLDIQGPPVTERKVEGPSRIELVGCRRCSVATLVWRASVLCIRSARLTVFLQEPPVVLPESLAERLHNAPRRKPTHERRSKRHLATNPSSVQAESLAKAVHPTSLPVMRAHQQRQQRADRIARQTVPELCESGAKVQGGSASPLATTGMEASSSPSLLRPNKSVQQPRGFCSLASCQSVGVVTPFASAHPLPSQ